MAFNINAVERPVPRSRSICIGVIMTEYERLSLKLQLAIARGQLLLMSTSDNGGLANSIIELERSVNAIAEDADSSAAAKIFEELSDGRLEAILVNRKIELLTMKFKELTGNDPPGGSPDAD
jgi:hypothetical protein